MIKCSTEVYHDEEYRSAVSGARLHSSFILASLTDMTYRPCDGPHAAHRWLGVAAAEAGMKSWHGAHTTASLPIAAVAQIVVVVGTRGSAGARPDTMAYALAPLLP